MTRTAAVLGSILLVAGCRYDMQDQPKYRPLQPSDFFADGRSARPLPQGTVARGHLRTDRLLYEGRVGPSTPQAQAVQAKSGSAPEQPVFDPSYATVFPMPVTREVLERGHQRFNIFCSPCHSYTGDGRGMIVQRGLTPPPSFHTDRLRAAPVGYFFDVITNGFGSMYSYAARVPVDDRWAIIAYIRALQASQNVSIQDLPPEARAKLGPPPPPGPGTGAGQIQPAAPPPTEQRPRDQKPEGGPR